MKGKKICATLAVVFLVLGLNFTSRAEDVYEEWVARWNGPDSNQDEPVAIDVDGSGHIYVTGRSWNVSTYDDYLSIKYSPYGDTEWVRLYDGPASGADWATALILDKSGNAYVTGSSFSESTSSDYTTIKYGPDGDAEWVVRYDGGGLSPDYVSQIAVDTNGNVFVTGTSYGISSNFDIATVKYQAAGDTAWVRRFNGAGNSIDEATYLAVDENGNVFVAGNSPRISLSSDYLIIKYNSNGDSLWVRNYNGHGNGYDVLTALDVDQQGNACVTGFSWNGDVTKYDYATVKYSPEGNQQTVSFLDGPSNGFDYALAVKAANDGSVHVTGGSWNDTTSGDYATVKYDQNGDTLWVRRYNGIGNVTDWANALAVDTNGNTYVTGRSWGGLESWNDFATVTYAPNGDMMWVKRFDGPSHLDEEVVDMVIDERTNVYVVGSSYSEETLNDYATIKYSPCTSSSPKAGNTNWDYTLSLTDIIYIVNYIFGKGPRPFTYPPCDSNLQDCWVYDRYCRYDWTGDKKITLGDCVRAVNYVFQKPGSWAPVPSLGCCPFPPQ